MKRVILDTNIYGLIVEKEEPENFKALIQKSDIVVYGNKIIRKELRSTPRVFIDGINLRFELSNKEIEAANSYYLAYKNMGGMLWFQKIMQLC